MPREYENGHLHIKYLNILFHVQNYDASHQSRKRTTAMESVQPDAAATPTPNPANTATTCNARR